jgi:hypothetical protein
MKKLSFKFSLLALVVLFLSSCELMPLEDALTTNTNPPSDDYSPCEDDMDIEFAALPDVIQEYIAANYDGAEINDIVVFDDDGNIRFGIEIEQGSDDLELLFNTAGELLSSGTEVEDILIDPAALPIGIQVYLEDNFSGIDISSAELDGEYGFSFYEVYLANGVELYFAEDGSFWCQDDDGHDDDDDDSDDDDSDDDDSDDDDSDDDDSDDDDSDDDDSDDDDSDDDDSDDDDSDDDDSDDDDGDLTISDLPDGVIDFINSNFGGYQIESVDREDLCDNTLVFEVELEDGPGPDLDLYFSMDGAFLFVEREIDVNQLPDAVLLAIENDFAGYSVDDDVEQREFPDGSLQYEVELESQNDDVDVIFDADGNVLCTDD